jgi:DNA-binding NtrC family response regulator
MLRQELERNQQVDLPPRGRAVVVDQNRKDLQTYTEVLLRLGFEVKPFTSYQEAARDLEKVTPDFVFVNQGTPAFEARGLVVRALARDRQTPVVVLAQSLSMDCYLEAMQLGAADYVEKPLASAEVEHLVTTYWQPRHAVLRHC